MSFIFRDLFQHPTRFAGNADLSGKLDAAAGRADFHGKAMRYEPKNALRIVPGKAIEQYPYVNSFAFTGCEKGLR